MRQFVFLILSSYSWLLPLVPHPVPLPAPQSCTHSVTYIRADGLQITQCIPPK